MSFTLLLSMLKDNTKYQSGLVSKCVTVIDNRVLTHMSSVAMTDV